MASTKRRNSSATPASVPPGSRSSAQAAKSHRQAREAHLSETAQDYVEAVADLLDTAGEARVVDLARRLGVTHVTVTQTIGRLKKLGLVRSEPYRSIFLTDDGRAMAAESRRRHEIVLDFLLALGISEETAHADAEGIEHHVSPETLAGMKRAMAALKGKA